MKASGPQLSLDDLLAFNAEVASLVRAGVPLGQGLKALGREMPGRVRRLFEEVGRRLEAGRPLDEVLASPELRLPQHYAAVVRAGIRGGRLPAALEAIAETGQRIAQVRQTARAAIWYPLLVALAAYGLFILWLTGTLPRLAAAIFADDNLGGQLLAQLVRLGESAPYWALLPVLLGVAGTVCWWRGTGRLPRDTGWAAVGRRASLHRVAALGHLATFAEVLAMLLEHGAPLDDALRLAAGAAGDRRLMAEADALAAAIAQGRLPDSRAGRKGAIPPFLRWLICAPAAGMPRTAGLRAAAQNYRGEAATLCQWLTVMLPIWLTLAIGATSVAAYAAVVLGPWYALLLQVGK